LKSLADEKQRRRIRSSLDETIVVEAAAGTGKTTELVCRIVGVLAQGHAEVGKIVAITFTEKAAGELKLRLRSELEKARSESITNTSLYRNLENAVERLEEAQINTIHGFCADLLRERPVEAGVDPMFEVLSEREAEELYEEAFESWLQRALGAPGEGLRRSLRRHSKEGPTEKLRAAGWELLNWRDFSAVWSRPEYDRTISIDRIIEQLRDFRHLTVNAFLPNSYFHRDTEIARSLSERLGSLEMIGTQDYDFAESLIVALAEDHNFVSPGVALGGQYSPGVTREAVRSSHGTLVTSMKDFVKIANCDLAALLQQELSEATKIYEQLKLQKGRLDFVDLLLRTRDMLRDSQPARADFQRRFSRIFVDEFQDTDPVQAEIILLLAARDAETKSWERADPIPGKLFIVGDPKQSIYRFRRADIGTYVKVKELLRNYGAVELQLTTSFRSRPSIQDYINSAFSPVMAEDLQNLQPAYVPLSPHRAEKSGQATVVALPVPEPYGAKKVAVKAVDASLPEAVCGFVDWLVRKSGWMVTESGNPDELVRIAPRHICLHCCPAKAGRAGDK
jgi:ATP-dependent helicase/nuclease subunit A